MSDQEPIVRQRSWTWRLLGVAAAVITILAVALFVAGLSEKLGSAQSNGASPPTPTSAAIAVHGTPSASPGSTPAVAVATTATPTATVKPVTPTPSPTGAATAVPSPTSTSTPSASSTPVAPVASPSPEPNTPTPQPSQTYVVQYGDTLSDIAQQFNVSVQQIVEMNNIADPNVILAGSTLKIPAP